MIKRFLLGLLGTSLAFASHAASELPTPGQQLSQEQISQWGKLPAYQVGKNTLQVIPGSPPDSRSTLLINAQGIVGVSHNEVSISQAPSQSVENRLRQVIPQPESIERFEQAGVTIARYADFHQAFEGWKAIKAAMPDAQVRLPIQFGQVRPY